MLNKIILHLLKEQTKEEQVLVYNPAGTQQFQTNNLSSVYSNTNFFTNFPTSISPPLYNSYINFPTNIQQPLTNLPASPLPTNFQSHETLSFLNSQSIYTQNSQNSFFSPTFSSINSYSRNNSFSNVEYRNNNNLP
jgi:hypothetical protein